MSRKPARKIASTTTYIVDLVALRSIRPNSYAARHRLDAVLAAGEFRLQREEEHHLRQRQRDHGEVDALPADRERAGDEAEHRARSACRSRIASSGGKPQTLAECAAR